MAITLSTVTRKGHTKTAGAQLEYLAFTLTGTYTTGGVAFPLGAITAGPGSSPLVAATNAVLFAEFQDLAGYIYVLNPTTGNLQIFSAPGTELAANAALNNTVTGIIHLLF